MAVPGTQTALSAAEMPTILVPTSATPLTTAIPTAGTSVIPEAQPPRRCLAEVVEERQRRLANIDGGNICAIVPPTEEEKKGL